MKNLRFREVTCPRSHSLWMARLELIPNLLASSYPRFSLWSEIASTIIIRGCGSGGGWKCRFPGAAPAARTQRPCRCWEWPRPWLCAGDPSFCRLSNILLNFAFWVIISGYCWLDLCINLCLLSNILTTHYYTASLWCSDCFQYPHRTLRF